MNLTCPLVADANYPLDGGVLFVDDVVAPVETFFARNLDIDWKINVIMTTSLPWLVIPEDGVGGRTYASDFVVVAVDPKNTVTAKISEMLAHELAHAVRWGKNSEWSEDLFCELVNEGLAVHFEAEFAKTQGSKTFFLGTILNRSDNENREIFERLRPRFEAEKYDYDEIFFDNGKLLRWMGYSAGYYIVGRYLEKTGKSVFDAIGDSYEDFRNYVA